MIKKTQTLNSFGSAQKSNPTQPNETTKTADASVTMSMEGAVAVKNAIANGKGTYDVNFGTIFKEPEVIATIVKNLIPAYKDCSVESICEMLGDIRTNKEVSPNSQKLQSILSKVKGLKISSRSPRIQSVVSKVKGEAAVYYDVFTTLKLPDWLNSIFVEIYTDFEMQRSDSPRYVLPKRSVYYAARMISDQLSAVTQNTDYGKINPVYSIWIVLTNDKDMKNKVVRYSLTNKTPNVGISAKKRRSYVKELNENIDLVNIIYIFLDKKLKREVEYNQDLDNVVEFLIMLFTGDLNSDKMKEKYIDFSVVDNEDWNKEVGKMFNAVEFARESRKEGREEGREEGSLEARVEAVLGIINDFSCSIEKAMSAAKVKEHEKALVREAVELYYAQNNQ